MYKHLLEYELLTSRDHLHALLDLFSDSNIASIVAFFAGYEPEVHTVLKARDNLFLLQYLVDQSLLGTLDEYKDALKYATLHGWVDGVAKIIQMKPELISTNVDDVILLEDWKWWTFSALDSLCVLACEHGQLVVAKYLISHMDRFPHYAALCLAMRNGHLDVVKYLMSSELDEYRWWPGLILRYTAREGHLHMVKYIVSAGMSSHITHECVILETCENDGDWEIAKYLVSVGTRVDYYDIMSEAIMFGKISIVKGIVSLDFSQTNDALINAVVYDRLNIAKYLVSVGADIHTRNDLAVRIASKKGQVGFVQYLISLRADIHAENDKSIRDAGTNGHLGVVQMLVSAGADIHTKKDEAIRGASTNGHLDVVQYLVSVGADIHAWNDEALREASRQGHQDVVQYLVSVGANIHEKDDEALREASRNGHLEIVKFLASAGANIHALDDYAVRIASEKGHLEVVKFLVMAGADVRACKSEAFRRASSNGHLPIIKYLDECKLVDIYPIYAAAVLLATQVGHLDVVKYLVSAGADIYMVLDKCMAESQRPGLTRYFEWIKRKQTRYQAILDALNDDDPEKASRLIKEQKVNLDNLFQWGCLKQSWKLVSFLESNGFDNFGVNGFYALKVVRDHPLPLFITRRLANKIMNYI